MKDIEHKNDIQHLIETFYNTALTDEIIGPVFKKANFSLKSHIPIMVSFWETVLLDVITYQGNPMVKHIELNQIVPLLPEHFKQWLSIWENTVRKEFTGPIADKAILRAASIAQIMQSKIKP